MANLALSLDGPLGASLSSQFFPTGASGADFPKDRA
jgi:hypothetical protein